MNSRWLKIIKSIYESIVVHKKPYIVRLKMQLKKKNREIWAIAIVWQHVICLLTQQSENIQNG